MENTLFSWASETRLASIWTLVDAWGCQSNDLWTPSIKCTQQYRKRCQVLPGKPTADLDHRGGVREFSPILLQDLCNLQHQLPLEAAKWPRLGRSSMRLEAKQIKLACNIRFPHQPSLSGIFRLKSRGNVLEDFCFEQLSSWTGWRKNFPGIAKELGAASTFVATWEFSTTDPVGRGPYESASYTGVTTGEITESEAIPGQTG